jgi:hypothetical protein
MSLPPVALNKLRVAQGQTKTFTIAVKTANGRVFDLSGFTEFRITVANGGTKVLEKVSPIGFDTSCAGEGVIVVTLSSTETMIPVGCYKWDAWAIKLSSVVGDPDLRYQIVRPSEFVVEQSITSF